MIGNAFAHRLYDLPDLASTTVEGQGRYYTLPDGTRYPSVTTVLGRLPDPDDWLARWVERVGVEEAARVRGRALSRGRQVHELAERYLSNEPDWARGAMPINLVNFRMAQPILDRNVREVYGLETALWSHTLRTAGRNDVACNYSGVNRIVDFKGASGVKTADDIPKYFIQAACYAIMFTELTGLNIPGIAIIVMPEHHGEAQEFLDDVERWRPEVLRVFRDRPKDQE